MSQELIDRITSLQQEMWRELEQIQNRMQQRAAQNGGQKQQSEYPDAQIPQVPDNELIVDNDAEPQNYDIDDQLLETSYPIPRTPNNEPESPKTPNDEEQNQPNDDVPPEKDNAPEEREELESLEKPESLAEPDLCDAPNVEAQNDLPPEQQVEEMPPEVDVPVQQELPSNTPSHPEPSQPSEEHSVVSHSSPEVQEEQKEDSIVQQENIQAHPDSENLPEIDDIPECPDIPDDLPPPPEE